VSSAYQRRRFLLAFLIILAALLLVLLFARSVSLLPLSVFQPLLDWLAGLFPERGMRFDTEPRIDTNPMYRDLSEMLAEMDAVPIPIFEIIRMLFMVLARIVVLLLVLLFLYYLLWPLLSSYFRAFLRTIHPLKALARKLMALVAFLSALARDLWSWLRGGDEREGRAGAAAPGTKRWRFGRTHKPGLRKRLEVGRVLKAFQQLIRWAGRRGVRYRPQVAPLEFARAVARVAPEHEMDLWRSMELMEEALFSPYLLSREKMRLYLELIRGVIRG